MVVQRVVQRVYAALYFHFYDHRRTYYPSAESKMRTGQPILVSAQADLQWRQCRINHVADVANATGLMPQGVSGSRENFFSPSVVK